MEKVERDRQPEVSLKPASDSDIATLLELENSVSGKATYSPMLDEGEWRDALKNSSVLLIRSGDEIVGNISFEEKSPEHLYISGMIVRPEFQGRGIARSALQTILDAHKGVSRVDLVTHPDNPARALYESMGFEVESRKENYFGDGEPRLVMVLKRSRT
jgi:ribosomal protein S18 acetylase RimI-like enzyme